VLLLSSVIIPVFFSLLKFVPFPATWSAKFNAWVIDPALFGAKQARYTRYGVDGAMTRGQAVFIFCIISINVLLSCLDYQWINPNA
jgi:uncharacterized membrane protein YbaN (DUF454 family)